MSKLQVPKNISINVRNMMNDGFNFGTKDKSFYPPVTMFKGKDADDIFAKIAKVLDNIAKEDISHVEIGTLGFTDIEQAIYKKNGEYVVFLAIAGTNPTKDTPDAAGF